MTGPQANMLSDGKRLHLNHGPIDLIIEADDTRAYSAAITRFETVLPELVSELTILRTEIPEHGLKLRGKIARRMERAVQPHWRSRVTPMAAVAGAVAEEILEAMLRAAPLRRAYVNNGGDIALHLEDDEAFTIASPSGKIVITADDNVRGLATSGWRGRSFSLGIADSVTVLARTASRADVAATMIANAVDLPGSPKVKRQAACEIAPDSDLRERLVTVGVEALREDEIEVALQSGLKIANQIVQTGKVRHAALLLQHHSIACTVTPFSIAPIRRHGPLQAGHPLAEASRNHSVGPPREAEDDGGIRARYIGEHVHA
jgi:uncharacterized protein